MNGQYLKELFRQTYLYNLLKEPLIFCVVIGFGAVNYYLNLRKVEFPPFYLWGMYSLPVKNKDTFTTYVLRFNNQRILNNNTLLSHQNGLLFTYTIKKYVKFQKQGGLQESPFGRWPCNKETEQQALRAYPAWLKAYTASGISETITALEVFEVKVCYTPDRRLKTLSSKKIISE